MGASETGFRPGISVTEYDNRYLSDKEALDLFDKETQELKRQGPNPHNPLGTIDPGDLADPERVRGSGRLSRQEKDYIYFWATKKRKAIEAHIGCHCWDRCPTCKLCLCTRVGRTDRCQHEDWHFRCLCGNGLVMISPRVIRRNPHLGNV